MILAADKTDANSDEDNDEQVELTILLFGDFNIDFKYDVVYLFSKSLIFL